MTNMQNDDSFSPLAWFGSLPPEMKLSMLRQVLSGFEKLDPGAVARMGLWKRAKTARMQADLPLPDGTVVRGVGIHLSVEGGDADLWRNLNRRAESGAVVFGEGAAGGPDGILMQGWLSSLGVGTLIVREERGELMFAATKRQLLSIGGMRPGAPLPTGLPSGEGFVITVLDGQLAIVGTFSGLRPDEVAAVGSAPIQLGLVPATPKLMILGLNVPGLTKGWADLPFSMAIEPLERRRLNPPEKDGDRPLLLVLADRRTGLVAAMRTLLMSSEWSAELERILESHVDLSGDYGFPDYQRDVEEAYRRWPSPNDLVKDFTAVDIGRDRPSP